MIIKTLRLLLLIISMYGYTRLFSKRMRTEFALGFTCTCIGSAMFFAGILKWPLLYLQEVFYAWHIH